MNDLQDLGLDPQAERDEDAQSPAGTVLELDPPAGAPVRKGSEVKVTFASSPQVEVPDLVGGDAKMAMIALRRMGLQPDPKPRDVPGIPAGTVLDLNPDSGAKVREGSVVTVIFALPPAASPGTEAPPEVKVPNLVGDHLKVALGELKRIGLQVLEQHETAGSAPWTVLKIIPAPGTPVPRDSVVTVIVEAPPAGPPGTKTPGGIPKPGKPPN